MNIKHDENLEFLAGRMMTTARDAEVKISAALINAGMVEDKYENCGWKMEDCFERDIYISEFITLLEGIGIPYVICRDLDALYELIYMGDYDCEECGGIMVETDEEWAEVRGGDYDSEPEFVKTSSYKRCTVCGNEHSYHEHLNVPHRKIER